MKREYYTNGLVCNPTLAQYDILFNFCEKYYDALIDIYRLACESNNSKCCRIRRILEDILQEEECANIRLYHKPQKNRK